MEKSIALLEKRLLPIANKVSSNRYLKAIGGGSMSLLGIIMVGAIFSIFANITWEPYTRFLSAYNLDTVIAFVPAVTTDLLAIYMAFTVAYQGATCFENGSYAMSSGLLSLVSFMLLVPMDSTSLEGITFYNVQYLGSRGAFVAIVTGLMTAKLLSVIVHRNIRIKMPEGVPPMISESLSSLIAGTIIIVMFVIIKVGFSMTEYGTFNDFIYLSIQTPLQAITGNLPAFLICLVLAQLLWFFGVHGSMTILPVLLPIWLTYIGENTAALAAGEAIVHPLNIAMYDLACLGGAGATIGLVILMAFTAKSKQYRHLGKLAFPCGLFGVNEPVIFGLPMILNPLMAIPFILCPVIIVLIGYFLIQIGIVGAPIGYFGVGSMPIFISGFMHGSVSWGVYQLVSIIISVLIYYPFFKIMDKQALTIEMEAQ